MKRTLKNSTRQRITNGIIHVLMIALSFLMLFPFLWMLSTSLKDKMHAQIFPPQWIPDPLQWDAYKEVWEVAPLLSGIKNSLTIALPVLIFGTLSSAMAAFAFAKMDLPCKNFLFMALLSSMMIPGVVTLIPQYVVWGKLGYVDTFIPLIVPGMLGNITMMFFFRQFLSGVPDVLIDAAKLDGASWFTIFRKIMLPAMKPAIAAQVIFWFMGIWNDFMGPLIYLDSEENYTIQLALRLLNSMSEATSEYPMIMAGAVISCLPLLILYICFQRYFVDSMVVSGIKG